MRVEQSIFAQDIQVKTPTTHTPQCRLVLTPDNRLENYYNCPRHLSTLGGYFPVLLYILVADPKNSFRGRVGWGTIIYGRRPPTYSSGTGGTLDPGANLYPHRLAICVNGCYLWIIIA